MPRFLPIVLALLGAGVAQAQPAEQVLEAPSLERVVRVELDDLDVPRVFAQTRSDAAYALGYLHGRERFFQMDLARRRASGRLSELAGSLTLGQDQAIRVWDFERVAHEVIERMPDDRRALLESYVSGVNEGLASLPTGPPEYLFVGATPEPWTLESSVLTTLTLVHELSGGRWSERWHDAARRTFNDDVYAFLHPDSGAFDASLSGDRAPLAPIPDAEDLDLRVSLAGWPEQEADDRQSAAPRFDPDGPLKGSNNWAIGGGKAAAGGAILASDPHLGLQLPNVWYRAELNWGEGEQHTRCVGITLPGFPVVIMGSNGHVAWGMTNVHGDFADSVIIPEGYAFTERREEIRVRGQAEPTVVTFRDTQWGPVVEDEDAYGRTLGAMWTGQRPEANDFAIFDMAGARTLESALDVAASWMSAPQNIVIAAKDGRVGWTLSGYLPARQGFDGSVPARWKAGEVGWTGQLPMSARPRVIREAQGVVFSANNRVASLEEAALLGRWFPDGVRAHRIRERLSAKKLFTERDMLDIQLDTRAKAYDRARDLVLEYVPEDTADPLLSKARAAALAWSGHADPDDTGHAFVTRVGENIRERVWEPFVVMVRRTDPDVWRGAQYSADTALRLIEAQPAHLLSPRFESWEALVRDAVRETARFMEANGVGGVNARWGLTNRASIQHPIAQIAGNILPGLSAPEDELAGDYTTVRVAGPNFGASMRLVVSPGREEQGLFHMPGGQAGRPNDPDFLSGHQAWVEGRPTPLLPGEAVEVLVLQPAPDDQAP